MVALAGEMNRLWVTCCDLYRIIRELLCSQTGCISYTRNTLCLHVFHCACRAQDRPIQLQAILLLWPRPVLCSVLCIVGLSVIGVVLDGTLQKSLNHVSDVGVAELLVLWRQVRVPSTEASILHTPSSRLLSATSSSHMQHQQKLRPNMICCLSGSVY